METVIVTREREREEKKETTTVWAERIESIQYKKKN
jgi:hypothetical protein